MSDKKRIVTIPSEGNLSRTEEKKNESKIAYFQTLPNQTNKNKEHLINSMFLNRGNTSLKKINPKNLEVTVNILMMFE